MATKLDDKKIVLPGNLPFDPRYTGGETLGRTITPEEFAEGVRRALQSYDQGDEVPSSRLASALRNMRNAFFHGNGNSIEALQARLDEIDRQREEILRQIEEANVSIDPKKPES